MASIFAAIKRTIIDHPYALVIVVLVVCVIFIEFGHFWHDEVQAVLKGKLFTVPQFDVDWWSLSHFLLFAVIGYIIPNHITEFALIGAGWEVFEDCMANDENKKLVSCDGAKSILCHGFKDSYWYGKWDDIIMNTAGYIVGHELRTRILIL